MEVYDSNLVVVERHVLGLVQFAVQGVAWLGFKNGVFDVAHFLTLELDEACRLDATEARKALCKVPFFDSNHEDRGTVAEELGVGVYNVEFEVACACLNIGLDFAVHFVSSISNKSQTVSFDRFHACANGGRVRWRHRRHV